MKTIIVIANLEFDTKKGKWKHKEIIRFKTPIEPWENMIEELIKCKQEQK